MGNPHIAGKVYAYAGNANSYVLARNESNSVEFDDDGIPIPPEQADCYAG
jgi:hypothetical protein